MTADEILQHARNAYSSGLCKPEEGCWADKDLEDNYCSCVLGAAIIDLDKSPKTALEIAQMAGEYIGIGGGLVVPAEQEFVAEKLGVSMEWVRGCVAGFDGWSCLNENEDYEEGYAFGCAARAEFLPDTPPKYEDDGGEDEEWDGDSEENEDYDYGEDDDD